MVKAGWKAAVNQPFVVLVLFLYRFLWGVVLYKLVQSVVTPLLLRYPGESLPTQSRVYLAEAQFQVIKTDLVHSYLWLLLGLLLARMLLTPLIQAGVCYSLAHTEMNSGYRFVHGVKQLSRPYLLYYAIQMTLTLLPLLWLVPKVAEAVADAASWSGLLLDTLPLIAGWIVYRYIIMLLFWYVQFGRVWSVPLGRTLFRTLTGVPRIAIIVLLTLLVTGAITAILVGASLWWAGFWSLVLYQLSRLVQSFLQVWTLASHHEWFKSATKPA